MDRLSDYDYNLPPELIAQEPLADRAASRLLVLNRSDATIQHRRFSDFPELLAPGDVMVVNETRVTALRLEGARADTGGRVELLVLRRLPIGGFVCLAKPARRLGPGILLEFEGGLSAEVVGLGPHGERIVKFSDPARLSEVGRVPLPPYITHQLEEAERYQTIYARPGSDAGSAAAPTAGLHFTPAVLEAVRARGVVVAAVSLEVGIDTFRPVQVDDIESHEMHGERCTLTPEAAEAIASAAGRVVAVGTTTARTLETFARREGSRGRRFSPGTTVSKLFLRPGQEFRIVDSLLTNFHLPRTTLLMMLSAFAGRETIMRAYAEAVQERYRLLSFGDAMFVQ
ncbi:MAG TPA: tRNA preQ1(34) S-adenosylmethionine ribosyltransferase-isomerase QueA [Fimbriimonadaceae bacterium]|nr:tRNA preQ1(34) S-adenosylmethionine ribosyltransferase-isomerase QueA [Fimbriimonadaceae bacterium]